MTNKIVGLDSTKKPDPCMFCGEDHHPFRCQRVKKLELYEDGSVNYVQFRKPKPPAP